MTFLVVCKLKIIKKLAMEDVRESDTSESESEPEVILDKINDNVELYHSMLTSIFPNVDPQYIKDICMDPPFDYGENDDLQVMFINHLISYNEGVDESSVLELDGLASDDSVEIINDGIVSQMVHLQDLQEIEIEKQNEDQLNEQLFSEYLQQDQEHIDEQLNILINILPDADPEFLRNFIEKNDNNTMLLQQFVESNLMDKNYEKRDRYYAKKQTKENVRQYTTDFNIENFLKQFPEPFEYFEGTERKGIYQDKILNFLKNRYHGLTEEYLKSMYTSNNFNLSLTDKHILLTNGFKPSVPENFKSDDILLLQEIAFIQNKNSIKRYLDDLKQREEEELHILRANNLLLECQCCYDELKPTECVECDNNHIFCYRCVIRGTRVVISNGQSSVECFVDCSKEINLSVLRKVLPEGLFEMLLKKRQEAEVKAAQLDGLVTCPFCPYQMELAPQIKIFTCKNPECMKITCRLCQKMNHLPIKCEDVIDDEKGRRFVEEEMTKALIRNCYKCQKPFVKLDGCNKMVCYCGAMMCYICRQPIIGYEHFERDGGCQTHQNSDLFDKEQVESRRIAATSKLRNDFPDIKIPDL